MKRTGRTELLKWGWLTFAVTVLVIIIFAIPRIPGKFKLMLAVPVYAMFVLLYYKYIALKKASYQEIFPADARSHKRKSSGGNRPDKKATGKS